MMDGRSREAHSSRCAEEVSKAFVKAWLRYAAETGWRGHVNEQIGDNGSVDESLRRI